MRPGITSVTADDCIKRVEHCDVDNRHRPAGTPGAELFSEDAVLSGSNWSMIETGGVNRDHVPTVKRIEAVLWAYKRMNVGCRVKQRTEYVVESVIRSEGDGQNRQNEASEQQRRFFHRSVSGGSLLHRHDIDSQNNFHSLNVGFRERTLNFLPDHVLRAVPNPQFHRRQICRVGQLLVMSSEVDSQTVALCEGLETSLAISFVSLVLIERQA